jgi:hypothetical protein
MIDGNNLIFVEVLLHYSDPVRRVVIVASCLTFVCSSIR